jgi:hypothetical protein
MSGSAWKDLNEKYMRRKEVWEKEVNLINKNCTSRHKGRVKRLLKQQ